MSLSSCSTTPGTAETDACLRPDPRAVELEVSIILAAGAILRLSLKKDESGLRDFPRRVAEQLNKPHQHHAYVSLVLTSLLVALTSYSHPAAPPLSTSTVS